MRSRHSDLAADHPVDRAAVENLLGALGHHARGVDVLGLLDAALLLLVQLRADPVLEVLDRVGADAELDEMKRHVSSHSFIGSIVISLRAFRNLASGRDRNCRPRSVDAARSARAPSSSPR